MSLFVKKELVFRIKFPLNMDGARILLALEESDAERKIISMHSKGHRGHIYLWTLFNCDFYALGSFRICHDVVIKCPVCTQNKPRKKLRYDRLNLAAGQMLSYAIDFKGPIACNGKKN